MGRFFGVGSFEGEGRKEEGKTSFVRSLEHATTGSDPFAS